MGKGIDLARENAPEHAAMLDQLKDQLLIVFLNRLGGGAAIPVAELDGTGGYVMSFEVDPDTRIFNFIVSKKQ